MTRSGRGSFYFSPALKAELASRRYAPLSQRKAPLRYDALVRWLEASGHLELDKHDAGAFPRACKAIERAIQDAFAEGYVSIERRRVIAAYTRDPILEQRLLSRFPTLREAIVVSLNSLEAATGEKAGEPNDDFYTNAVHEQMGLAFAKHIAGQVEFFRTNDVIAVGSGRGVHHAIASLGRMNVSEIHIQSFSGSLAQQKAIGDQGHIWDADDNAMSLARRFTGSVHVGQIINPVICRVEQRNLILRDTHLGKRQFDKRVPTHGIFGIGIVDANHYLCRDLAKKRVERGGDPIDEFGWGPNVEFYRVLNRLVAKSEEVHKAWPIYWPVAEIGNHFFLVEPELDSPSRSILSEMRGEFLDLIRSLNDRLLAPTGEQFYAIKTVTLIAGTSMKALAIRTLLASPERHSEQDDGGSNTPLLPTIRRICLDETAAKAVLGQIPQ